MKKKDISQTISAIEAAYNLSQFDKDYNGQAVSLLLDKAFQNPKAQIIGLSGPPGVGKSSLANVLLKHWRAMGKTVAVMAVDPSSAKSGGAVLGDRIRMQCDPLDEGIYIRSLSAGDRLGGVSKSSFAILVWLRSIFDIVLIETVGVGQSEIDIASMVDTLALCVQPASGDAIQFMKSGIMEFPQFFIVTKADISTYAMRSVAELKGAISLHSYDKDMFIPQVLKVSIEDENAQKQIIAAFEQHFEWVQTNNYNYLWFERCDYWLKEAIKEHYGKTGLKILQQSHTQNILIFKDLQPLFNKMQLIFQKI